MKKISVILLFLLIFGKVYSQDNLNVSRFFSQEYLKDKSVTSIVLSGGDMQIFEDKGIKGITTYKSITIADNQELSNKVRDAVVKDGGNAITKEVALKDGEVYLGLYVMPPNETKQRYLLFHDSRPTGKNKVTLIFIEGHVKEQNIRKLLNL